MIKTVGVRIGFLLFVLLTFSTMALADGGTTFKLELQDFETSGTSGLLTTGAQVVITDNDIVSRSSYNDTNGVKGDIAWQGNVGNFFVTITATSTDPNSGATSGGYLMSTLSGGQLTLNATATYEGTAGDTLVLSLDDQGYTATPSSTVLLQSTVNNTSLTGTANSLTTNTWLTTATGDLPTFGAEGATGSAASPKAISVPIPSGPTAAGGVASNGSMDVTVSSTATSTNLFTQAAVSFGAGPSGSSTASFALTAADPDLSGGGSVPEPTSLMLLGSALLGLVVLRKRT